MRSRLSLLLVLCLAVPPSLFADFQYQQTTKITGGALVGMMKLAGTFSKQARQANEPIVSTVLVKGNRMARINKDSTEIIDLDKETITRIDHTNKQYSVITFQQLKQQIEESAREAQKKRGEKNQAEQPEMKFSVKVRNTGAGKQVSGLDTKEAILNMTMEATDKKTGETGAMAITNDMWMSPEIPGYAEVRDFERRWAEKMGLVFGGGINQSIAAMQPGMGEGMAEMVKEMSKLRGVPVLQVLRMGTSPNGQPLPAASEAPLPPSPEMPSAGDVAKQSATSAITSRIGLGGLGGFGRKKKQEQPAEQPSQQGSQNAPPAVLIESNTEMGGFSSAAIDAARFDIPAGYKQVEPEKRK